MDPTRESTYQFLDKFIGEMTGLFPDTYFHIDGDECNGKEWDAPRASSCTRKPTNSRPPPRYRLTSPAGYNNHRTSQDHGRLGRRTSTKHTARCRHPVMAWSADAKRRIGMVASELIGEREIVGLTAGATTTQIGRSLRHRRGIVVITNALNIGMELCNQLSSRRC
jgi:hypothetical protein